MTDARNTHIDPDDYVGTDFEKIRQAEADARKLGLPLRLSRTYHIPAGSRPPEAGGHGGRATGGFLPPVPVTPRTRVVGVLGGMNLTPDEAEAVVEYVMSRIRRPMPEPVDVGSTRIAPTIEDYRQADRVVTELHDVGYEADDILRKMVLDPGQTVDVAIRELVENWQDETAGRPRRHTAPNLSVTPMPTRDPITPTLRPESLDDVKGVWPPEQIRAEWENVPTVPGPHTPTDRGDLITSAAKYEDIDALRRLRPEPHAWPAPELPELPEFAEVEYVRPRVWPHVLLAAAAFIAGRISR